MNKFVCVHGHFYQPPRENPWTGEIDPQETASPYNNWNERITAECYTANAHTEIVNEDQSISLVNNYAKISFNFGPTLLAWLERHAYETYRAVIDADRESQKRFSGHGSAIAQGYNHMILPLADAHDKRTQIIWGMREFEYRFKRSPEGMWLPETAVDTETMELLASLGIKFTILSPHQIDKVKHAGETKWSKVNPDAMDTTVPYLCRLPSGKDIAVFVYKGHIAVDVAFGQLLDDDEAFTFRILREFDQPSGADRLVHFATDGETYGHHHKKGNRTLAHFLQFVESKTDVKLVNYGQYLETHPPVHELKIKEKSSWSCAHGVERWQSDCGCSIDRNKLWNQKWREKLRDALDALRRQLDEIFTKEMSPCFQNPWKVRDDFVDFILKKDRGAFLGYLKNVAQSEIPEDQVNKIFQALEMQHQGMLMYTSCGWFFDDISGLETRQILQYAARAIQLAGQLGYENLEEKFLKKLEAAQSNLPEMQNGRKVYEVYIKPALTN